MMLQVRDSGQIVSQKFNAEAPEISEGLWGLIHKARKLIEPYRVVRLVRGVLGLAHLLLALSASACCIGFGAECFRPPEKS